MIREFVFKHTVNSKSIFLIRFVCLIFMGLLLINIKVNPMGFSVLLFILIIIFFFSSIKEVSIYMEYIEFSSKRILPILSKSYSIKFSEVLYVEFKEEKINYLILILPGVGAIKNASLIFYLKNGEIIEESIKGKQNSIKELYNILDNLKVTKQHSPLS